MVKSGSKAGSVGAELRVSGFGFEFGGRLTDSWQIASGPTSVVRTQDSQDFPFPGWTLVRGQAPNPLPYPHCTPI